MGETLKSYMHPAADLGAVVVTPGQLNELDALMKNPGVKILCLQVGPESMNEARARSLVEWVRSGKTVWIYDSRIASWFGMESCPLTPEQFSHKPEDAQLGGKKVNGLATVALAVGGHEVDTGVGQVSLFLPDHGNAYGAVWAKGDTIALLQWAPGSPALAALRREGRGAIVYKPLLWNEVLSGDRFQANLLEWSAGFQVPGDAAEGTVGSPPGPRAANLEGRPAVPLFSPPQQPLPVVTTGSGRDRLVSAQGTLAGEISDELFPFELADQTLNLPRSAIRSIELGGDKGLDVLNTRNGRSFKGVLRMPVIHLKNDGQTREIAKDSLRRLELGP